MSPAPSPLLVAPDFSQEEYIRVTPATAGWESLHFAARRLERGRTWSSETGADELALVVLGGSCSVASNRGNWEQVGRRPNVFAGMPYTLYLPRGTRFTVTPESEALDIAYGWAKALGDHPARLVRPEEVEVEIRGGGSATRQVNKMIPPGFDCSRLVVVEVYTPSGSWSSYPPHKHDHHTVDAAGNLVEADLEEVYFYKIDRPEGFAIQRIYTAPGSSSGSSIAAGSSTAAGNSTAAGSSTADAAGDRDELILARDSSLVLSPEGYHPVVAAPGYNCYYLNMLAGSAQSLAASDDPQYAWVKETWKDKDPRLPLVSMEMET